LVGISLEKVTLRKQRRRWKDKIKVVCGDGSDLKEFMIVSSGGVCYKRC
jgi:hypothetical protein